MLRLDKVYTQYGAPMGRIAYHGPISGPLTVFQVTLDHDGYDQGGAYWGTPNNLFCATDDEAFRVFHRAKDRQTMIAHIRATWPEATINPDFDVDAFIVGYLECAVWSSIDDEGTPLDREYSVDDLTDKARKTARKECLDFIKANLSDLQGLDPSQCGHDLCLTRNHHGAGFWDRGYGELGDRLTKASHAYGESNLYVSRAGKLNFD